MDSNESARPIDRLFTMLLVKYGSQWLQQWNGVPIEAVKADWMEELSGISWGSIKYAMENLPADKPPATAAAFRKLINNRPQYFQALAAPKADPVRVKQILGGMRILSAGDKHAWARALQQREESGERLSPTQKQAWRQALNHKEDRND